MRYNLENCWDRPCYIENIQKKCEPALLTIVDTKKWQPLSLLYPGVIDHLN